MAIVVGILAETSSTSGGSTQTLYTVPSGKHARVRILYIHEGGGGTTQGNIWVFAPANQQTIHDTGGAGTDRWSGATGRLSAGTTTNTNTPQNDSLVDFGMIEQTNQMDLDGVSFTGEHVAVPFPGDYFGNAGDTIQWRWQNQPPYACLIQVYGVEDDNA